MASDSPLSILIVEHDADQRAALAALFGDVAYDVVAVGDGQEAFEHLLVHETLPHAIVLDLHVPHLGGWELLGLVRTYHRFANIPVIVISADDMPAVAFATTGRTAHCRKPIDPDALLSLVRSLGTQ